MRDKSGDDRFLCEEGKGEELNKRARLHKGFGSFFRIFRCGLRLVGALEAARTIRKDWFFRRNDNNRTLIYVHIGKCGGTTLRQALCESPTIHNEYEKILRVHLSKPPILKSAHYMIVVRNPIQRALSAFNYVYYIVVEKGARRKEWPKEYDILKKYETLNQLGESLYTGQKLCKEAADDFERIRHLHARISFYLTDLLTQIDPKQVRFVLVQETLNRDIKSMLNLENTKKYNSLNYSKAVEKNYLSEAAYFNLKRYMRDDYEALEKLLSIFNASETHSDLLFK